MVDYYMYEDIKDMPNEFLQELLKAQTNFKKAFPTWKGRFNINTYKRRTQIIFDFDGIEREREGVHIAIVALLKKFRLKYRFSTAG